MIQPSHSAIFSEDFVPFVDTQLSRRCCQPLTLSRTTGASFTIYLPRMLPSVKSSVENIQTKDIVKMWY